jgi:2-dehydropantoate 2-reductase
VRILIVGAGAIGGYFGARLIAAGRDVTFLVRARRADQLRRNGLDVTSPLGDLKLPTPQLARAGELDGFHDLVIISSKAYDLEGSVKDFAPAVGPHSLVLPLLNGMRHLDVLDANFGAGRVLGGVARISSTLQPDGAIHQLGRFNSLAFGARQRDQDRIAHIADALRVSGFEANLSADILHEMWEKWAFIAAAAATTSLMRAAIGDIMTAGARDIPLGLLQECAAIAADHGFAPREAAKNAAVSVLTQPDSPFTASMLRDIEQGARTEADHIIGDLIGRAKGQATPLLATAYAQLRSYEARRRRESAVA